MAAKKTGRDKTAGVAKTVAQLDQSADSSEAAQGPLQLQQAVGDEVPLLIYQSANDSEVALRVEARSFWATQAQMAALFAVEEHTITYHLSQIFGEGELERGATARKIRVVRREGNRQVKREIEHFDLNAVISVGYRVGGKAGTQFRIWATSRLIQYLTKGFVVDVRRLTDEGDADVLSEFRSIARQIRAAIRNSYREVLNLCTLCADYDGSSETARAFFMAMENKLLWAAANKTAPQLILERADAEADNMGLTSYSGRRGPTQRDVVIGNNYLAQGEAERKNRITEMWLTYVEEQLDQGRLPTMEAVREKLDGFIAFNQWALLRDKGQHRREEANAHALRQLQLYKERLRAETEAGRRLGTER